jgi:hypothetical protein
MLVRFEAQTLLYGHADMHSALSQLFQQVTSRMNLFLITNGSGGDERMRGQLWIYRREQQSKHSAARLFLVQQRRHL